MTVVLRSGSQCRQQLCSQSHSTENRSVLYGPVYTQTQHNITETHFYCVTIYTIHSYWLCLWSFFNDLLYFWRPVVTAEEKKWGEELKKTEVGRKQRFTNVSTALSGRRPAYKRSSPLGHITNTLHKSHKMSEGHSLNSECSKSHLGENRRPLVLFHPSTPAQAPFLPSVGLGTWPKAAEKKGTVILLQHWLAEWGQTHNYTYNLRRECARVWIKTTNWEICIHTHTQTPITLVFNLHI